MRPTVRRHAEFARRAGTVKRGGQRENKPHARKNKPRA
jgi:hypothetical protein